jgi:hypothetical protein
MSAAEPNDTSETRYTEFVECVALPNNRASIVSYDADINLTEPNIEFSAASTFVLPVLYGSEYRMLDESFDAIRAQSAELKLPAGTFAFAT